MSASPRERFAALAAGEDRDIDLALGALLVSAEADPGLDPEHGLAQLDALAKRVRPDFTRASGPAERVAVLNQFLFHGEGFTGNRSAYSDPRNSFLSQVLERRTGLPITLSVVWLEVAWRLGLDASGIGFPGHFLVRAEGESPLVIDPFHGGIATRSDCEDLLRAVLGPDAELRQEHLRPVGPRQILARILANLKRVYCQREDWEAALSCADRLLLLLPDAPVELRDRGLIHARLECFRAALHDLERFVELSDDARVSRALQETLASLRERAQQLH